MKFFFSPRFSVRRLARLASALGVITASALQASVVRAWNCALGEWLSEPDAWRVLALEARACAMMHLAMEEAADDTRRRIGADVVDVAANAAAHEIIADLLPRVRRQADGVAATWGPASPTDRTRRAEVAGRASARRWLRLRSDDGWRAAALGGLLEQRPAMPKLRAAPASTATEAEASPWLSLRPMSLKSAMEVDVGEPEYVTMNGAIRVNYPLIRSELFKHVRRDLPEGMLQRTWTGSPVLVWNRIARAIAEPAALGTVAEARLFAAMNVALADAYLGAAHWRFVLGTWRTMLVDALEDSREARHGLGPPVEAQFDGMESGVTRLVQRRVLLAPRPDYPSVVAALAGAATSALNGHAPTKSRGFELAVAGADAGELGPKRWFSSSDEAGREAAFVASLSGLNGATAAAAGYELGASIGRAVTARRSRRGE